MDLYAILSEMKVYSRKLHDETVIAHYECPLSATSLSHCFDRGGSIRKMVNLYQCLAKDFKQLEILISENDRLDNFVSCHREDN